MPLLQAPGNIRKPSGFLMFLGVTKGNIDLIRVNIAIFYTYKQYEI